MIRKSSLVLALALSVATSGAQALGLGDIDLKSALNQNFNADITLLSVEKGTLDDVRVALASPEAFEQAGVDRPYLLSKLYFKPERLEDGRAVIRVTSREPIREPFLNFVIEVNWPKGRLLREYTVLLDPPVTLQRKPAPVEAPVAAAEPAPEVVPEAVPETTAEAVPETTPETAAVTAPATPAGEATGIAMEEGVVGGEYGPVKKGDSLWVIAEGSMHQGADINQMMFAIYRANPKAFFNNNINNLKAGQILRIPDREETMGISKREARDQYSEHLNAWMAEKQVAAVAATETEAKPETQPEVKPGTGATETTAGSEAAEGTAAEKPQAQTPDAELKIATARPEGEGEAGAAEEAPTEEMVARLKQELLIAKEDAESARLEGGELHSRVTELESQLADLQRLLDLKSEQLAQLQAGLSEAEQLPEEAPAEEAAPEAPAEEAAAAEATPTEEVPAETTETEAAAVPEGEEVVLDIPAEGEAAMEPAPEAGMATEEAAAPPETEPAPAETVVEPEQPVPPVVAEVQPPEPKPAPKPQPKPEKKTGLLGGLVDETTGIIAGVGFIVVLLLVMWLMRSRKSGQEEFEESILIEGGNEGLSDTALQDAEEVLGQTDETSFLSDFSPSDIDALQDETGEVDPLAEADVYIAYGRYQQAEELLKQAIDREPGRHALKYKMFEIFYAVKDANGFVALAKELAGTPVQFSDSAAWEKVVSMGRELAPSHELFAGGKPMPSEGPGDDVIALEEELGVETTGFDLDAIATDTDEGGAADTTADDLADLDLDDIAASLDDDAEAEAPVGEASDFDLELDSAFTELEGGELDDIGLELAQGASEDEDEEGSDMLDLGEEKVIDFPAEDMVADDLSLDELGGGMEAALHGGDDDDEVSTKLDLARAYLDMGDPEGASDIIDEVLAEGNADQKREAQQLRDQLS